MLDRFRLEELIGESGNFEDDIDTVISRLLDHPEKVDEDEMANALIGIKTLHKLRREETFRVLEHLIEKGDLK
tara:strand:- start:525 stop:743 length:219 start_codon:yes stop_codon:yes gene_type:complete